MNQDSRRYIFSKPGFYNVKEILQFLHFPLTSPHTVHKESIESPLTPDTIHHFQAWNTHHSTPRGQNERMAYLYKYAVLLCHVTCTYTHTHTVVCSRYIKAPRATTAVLKKLGLDVPQQPLLPPLWEWFRSDSPSEVIILCEENSQVQGGLWKTGCGSVYIFENTYWTLLWLCPFLPVESLLCPLN